MVYTNTYCEFLLSIVEFKNCSTCLNPLACYDYRYRNKLEKGQQNI